MAKPPKKIPRLQSPDSPPTPIGHSDSPLRVTTDETVNPDPDAINLPASTGASSASALPALQRPTVIMHHLPVSTSPRPSVTIHHFAEVSALTRAVDWVALHFSEHQQTTAASSSASQRAPHPVFINAESASQLKLQQGTEEGFRYDKRKKAYVEMHEGMVMVGKTPDGWRQTHAGESTPTGERVEQIPGTKLWREITGPRQDHPAATESVPTATADAMPGPSKRPHLAEEGDVAPNTGLLVERLAVQQVTALDLSTAQWRNWGKTTKPATGESIEIEGLHYPLVRQVLHADTELVYVQHPMFKPEGFDEFEHMLRHESSMQPKWALKRNGQWKVLDNHAPFEMSATQYVSTALSSLSEHSANNLARAVFDRVATPQGIDAGGLSTMTLTLRYWADRANNTSPQPGLADPLMLLPTLPVQPHAQYPGGVLPLPVPDSNRLQRLDFKFHELDSMPNTASARDLFERILGLNGYSINPNRHPHPSGEDVMIFHREGVAAVFVLKLPPVTQTPIPRYSAVGTELVHPQFLSKISAADKQALAEHLNNYEVIYLVGGKEQISPDHSTLFIVREG
jgi:hypothetical protein